MTNDPRGETNRALEALLLKSSYLDEEQRRLEKVNVLDVFHIRSNELAHSAFWAWLFDPNETHKMGDRFLRLFLRLCVTYKPEEEEAKYAPSLWTPPKLIEIEAADLTHATVMTEKQPKWMEGREDEGDRIARRRFDIKIEFPLDSERIVLVVVEFKIEARESKDQLADYAFAISEAVENAAQPFKHALAVFVDYNSKLPTDANFLPLPLEKLVRNVLVPIFDSSADIMPLMAARLLGQYRSSVLDEVEQEEELSHHPDPKKYREEFIEHHVKAFAALRSYMRMPGLADLMESEILPNGETILFKDKKDSASVEGVIKVSGGQPEITVRKDGHEHGPFHTLSAAAKAAGTRQAYNGWTQWSLGGKSLDTIRAEFKRTKTAEDELCGAILNGRRRAVERLIEEAEQNGALAELAGRRPSGSPQNSWLTVMVDRGKLSIGQKLYFKKSSDKTCEVVRRGDQVALKIGDKYFQTPSGASVLLYNNRRSSGFRDLYYQDAAGTFRRLEDMRDKDHEEMEAEKTKES